MDQRSERLEGLRILVAEDEMLVLMDVENILEELGCEVIGPASTVAATLLAIENNVLDGALLDMNLRRESVLPAAEKLLALGVPFLFVTGYAGRSGETSILTDTPRVTKPFTRQALTTAMIDAFTLHQEPSER